MKKALLLICLALVILPGLASAVMMAPSFHGCFLYDPETKTERFIGGIGDWVLIDPAGWSDPIDPVSARGLDIEILAGIAYTVFAEDTVDKYPIIYASIDPRYRIPIAELVYPYVGAGLGFYYLGDTESTAFGVNVLAGIGIGLTDRLALEIGGGYHYLFDEDNTSLIQGNVGILYGFGK